MRKTFTQYKCRKHPVTCNISLAYLSEGIEFNDNLLSRKYLLNSHNYKLPVQFVWSTQRKISGLGYTYDKSDDSSNNSGDDIFEDNYEMPTTVNRASSFGSTKRSLLKNRGSSVKRHSSFRFMSRDTKDTDKRLTLDILQSLTPNKDGKDTVTEAARNLLLNCIKMEPHVHDIFFPEAVKDHRIGQRDLIGFPLKKLATALVAQAISGVKNDQKFYETIDRKELDSVLNDVYDSLHWKKIGFSLYTKLYPEVVRDEKTNISLTDFIEDDGHKWAERLLATIMDPRWTLLRMQHIIRGLETEDEYNTEMNALFVKLHLLDPQSVIPAYQFLMNQKALPVVNLELATRNYLGGPLSTLCIEKDVEAAMLKTSMPVNVSRLSLNEIEIFNGVEVDEFIVTECRNLGVWNGTRPNNIQKSKVTDRCCVM